MQTSQIGVDAAKDKKLMVFFVNPALLEAPKTSDSQRRGTIFNRRASSIGSNANAKLVADKITDEPVDQLFSDIGIFDIRKGICTNLLDPDPTNNQVGTTAAQRSLLGQYEKENRLFDVYQDLDPYDIKLRINAFERDDFKLLSSANIAGDVLKKYLKEDKKTFLIEPQNREDLGKYLVENLLVDESKNAMLLLKSQLEFENDPPPI